MSNLDLNTIRAVANYMHPSPVEKKIAENTREDAIKTHVPAGFKSSKPLENMKDEEFLLMLMASRLDEISSKLDKLIEDKGSSK